MIDENIVVMVATGVTAVATVGIWFNAIASRKLSRQIAEASTLQFKAIAEAAQIQFVTSMMTAFQEHWHNPRAILMRRHLHSTAFETALDSAIKEAYGTKISYRNIERLLERTELKGPATDSERLKKFEDHLEHQKVPNPLDPSKQFFSLHQAVDEVLLSFDRLALGRDLPFMMEKFISRYKPPIGSLSKILQAFIAVQILLREPKDDKNYKKDYMHMLGLLGLSHPVLFKRCEEGLISQGELSEKEKLDWDGIRKPQSS